MLEDVIAPAMFATMCGCLGGRGSALCARTGTAFESPWDLDMFLSRYHPVGARVCLGRFALCAFCAFPGSVIPLNS